MCADVIEIPRPSPGDTGMIQRSRLIVAPCEHISFPFVAAPFTSRYDIISVLRFAPNPVSPGAQPRREGGH